MSETPAAPPALGDRYYDGRSALAHPVRPIFTGSALRILAADGRGLAQWPLSEIERIDAPDAAGSMTFALAGSEGARLILHDGAVRAALLAARPALGTWRRRQRHRGLRRAAFWTAAAALLLALFYFGWPSVAAGLAEAMPRRWELPLGRSMRASFLAIAPTCQGRDGLAALDGLLRRLAPDQIEDPPITVDVIDSGVVNAFALPGNHIELFRGLIEKAATGDELAGVLAHELAHLELRHPLRGAIQQMGLQAVMTLALGGSDLGSVGQVVAAFSYTRRMEAEADARGVALLEGAHLRADGLARFFRRLQPEEAGGLLPDWLSNHPGLAERIAATDRPANGAPAFDAAAWAAVKAVCAKP